MEEVVRTVRGMILSGRSLTAVVTYLRGQAHVPFTAFNLLRILQDSVGVPLTEARSLLELFDREMNLVADRGTADKAGEQVLGPYRS